MSRGRRLAALLLALALPAGAQTLAVVGGEVHTGDGDVLRGVTVFVEDGKITAVGTDVEVPEGVEIVAAAGMVVTPGLLDAHTILGAGAPQTPPSPLDEGPVLPLERAVDRFRENLAPLWLRSGVTAAYLAPDPGQLLGGTGAVVKLFGPRETAVVDEEAGVAASFGESAVGNRPPGRDAPTRRTTRQGMIFDLRNTLVAASEDAVEGPAGGTLGRLLAGEIPLRMLANTPDDIETALRVAGEFDVRLVVDHAAGAPGIADRLAAAGVPVVVGPMVLGIGDGGPMELRGHTPAAAGILHRAGVEIALSTFAGRGRSVWMEAVLASAHGLPSEAALTAVTADAADVLGVSDRLGRIAVGLDADLVVWDRHPISTWANTAVVIVDGRVAFRR